MKKRFRGRAGKWPLLIGILIASVAGYLSMHFLRPEPTPSLPQESSSRTLVTHTLAPSPPEAREKLYPGPASRVYVDPRTGQFRRPPADEGSDGLVPDVVEDVQRNPATDESQEFMSPVAGGGVVTKVRLRFRRPLMATKDADGNLKIQHAPQETDLNGQQ